MQNEQERAVCANEPDRFAVHTGSKQRSSHGLRPDNGMRTIAHEIVI